MKLARLNLGTGGSLGSEVRSGTLLASVTLFESPDSVLLVLTKVPLRNSKLFIDAALDRLSVLDSRQEPLPLLAVVNRPPALLDVACTGAETVTPDPVTSATLDADCTDWDESVLLLRLLLIRLSGE
jgi:hypothetical protein